MYVQILTNKYEVENVMTEKNATLSLRIEESLLHDYKNMCEERGVVMSKVIRKLLMEDLENYQNWNASQQLKKAKKNGR